MMLAYAEERHLGGFVVNGIERPLLAAAWDDTDTVFDVVAAYYRRLCEYMQFADQGMILGRGCGTPAMTKNSGYVEKAYTLGRTL